VAARADLSRTQAATLIANGNVTVNGKHERASYKPVRGDVIAAEEPAIHEIEMLPESLARYSFPDGPIWRYREDHLVAQLSPSELAAWQAAREVAAKQGLLFMAHPMHCVVGHKPAS
jgi:23S rRNA-/tRNA-specific pseudouridylate synthase